MGCHKKAGFVVRSVSWLHSMVLHKRTCCCSSDVIFDTLKTDDIQRSDYRMQIYSIYVYFFVDIICTIVSTADVA